MPTQAEITSQINEFMQAFEEISINAEFEIPGNLQVEAMRPYLLTAFGSVNSLGKREYESTIKTWNQDGTSMRRSDGSVENHEYPTFEFLTASGGRRPQLPSRAEMMSGDGEIRSGVFTTDIRYIWIDQGTQPHTIPDPNVQRLPGPDERRPPTRLAYRSDKGKPPKTTPGQLGSGAGNANPSGEWVYADSVTQSIRPRGFTALVRDKMLEKLEQQIPYQMNKAVEWSVKQAQARSTKHDVEMK